MANYADTRYSMTDQEDFDSRGGGALVTKGDKQKLSALANDAIKKSAAAMENAEVGKTEKFLGFTVDAGLAAYLSSIYNIVSDNLSQVMWKKTYELTRRGGVQLGMAYNGMPLKQTAAVTTFLVTAGLKSAADIGKVTTAFSEQKKERQKLAHWLAPVLDDIKGRHSLSAFGRVREGDNEVIFAHRQRLAKIAKAENSSRLIGMAMNVVPNVALDLPHFNRMWAGMTPDLIHKAAMKDEAARKLRADSGVDEASFGNLGRTFVQATTGQVSGRIEQSSQLRLRKTLQPYSALEMIRELEQQVESNPKASSFQLPKGFQGANRHPESYPLEEYVSLIFIQHQRDMADIKEDHTQIREALHEDLAKAVKPIAAAIRSGNLSVMSLIRLVGEHQVIKNKGRAIAEPQVVEDLIKRSSAYVHTDLEEFYKNSPVSREEMKKLIDKLEGDDLLIYVSLLPRAVQEDLGVKKDVIKKVHGRARQNQEALADMVVGVHQQSQAELKQAGLVAKEIHEVDAVYEAIKRGGPEAVAEYMASPTNPKGIEAIIANVAASRIQGGQHLGVLVDKGKQKIQSLEANFERAAPEAAREEAPMGEERSFSAREQRRESDREQDGFERD